MQSEHYLRDSKGDIVVDETTGEARRVDHVVIENGQVKEVVETTSMTANKTQQQAKEDRIMNEQGGNYIKDKETGCVLEITCKITVDRRD